MTKQCAWKDVQLSNIFEIHSRGERDWGLPWWLSGKEFACQRRRYSFDS